MNTDLTPDTLPPPLGGSGRPASGPATEDRRQHDRRRFAADPRFAGWVAGSKA